MALCSRSIRKLPMAAAEPVRALFWLAAETARLKVETRWLERRILRIGQANLPSRFVHEEGHLRMPSNHQFGGKRPRLGSARSFTIRLGKIIMRKSGSETVSPGR